MAVYNTKEEKLPTEYLLNEYDALLKCESLGFYNCCENIAVYVIKKDTKEIFNIYNIFVFEERINVVEDESYLTETPVSITDNFSLGIEKKILSVDKVRNIYKKICECRSSVVIDLDGSKLQIGSLEGVPKVFIQENSTKTVTVNKILKNNFKNGSYVLEFFDVEKKVKDFFDSLEFKKLTSEIYKVIPIDLLSVSDRIGNFVFQFPSLNMNVSYTTDKDERTFSYHVSIDERISDKCQLQLQSEVIFDDSIIGFGTALCNKYNTDVTFDVGNSSDLCKSTLIDLDNNLILSRRETTFIREMIILGEIGDSHEYREIYDKNGGSAKLISVNSFVDINIPQPILRKRKDFVNSRQYEKRIEDLYNRREFRSYGRGKNEHDKAIEDVIELMNMCDAKTEKVYLWDPYLTAKDLLATWYCTKTYNLPILAVTSREAKIYDEKMKDNSVSSWINEQKNIFEKSSNNYGIKLEMRCQWNGHGYAFHDRFLMLLMKDGTSKVWSLGTSINSVGNKHHVIQNVENPQMIVDAFEDLWNELDSPECLVWKRE